MPVTVSIKLDGLEGIKKAATNPAVAKRISDSWAIIFRSFIRQRFNTFSRGGGDWKPLAASTLKRRRKGKKGGAGAAILRDTGILFASLQPTLNNTGLLKSTPRPLGFTITLDSPTTYSDGGGVSIGDVAKFHQTGGKNLPKREILVPPDKPTIKEMSVKAKQIIAKILKERGRGAG